MKDLSYITKTGRDIESVSADFAQLRISVFREFPYLYEGSLDYELDYIQTYSGSEKSMLFGVYYKDKMIGATTCIPLKDETEEIQRPFLDADMDTDKIFYFGESLLLPEYRGLGLGHRFFDKRESHAKSFKTYNTTCFCAVNRPENHPLKPLDYRPNDSFWLKRGYRKNPELRCSLNWLDVKENESTPKELTFWSKSMHF